MRTLARVQGPSLSTSIAGGGTIRHFGMQEPSSRLLALGCYFLCLGSVSLGVGGPFSLHCRPSLCYGPAHQAGVVCPVPTAPSPGSGSLRGSLQRTLRESGGRGSAPAQAQPASWGVGWLTLKAHASCLPSLDQPVAQSHPVC